jgi:hypothetical protein
VADEIETPSAHLILPYFMLPEIFVVSTRAAGARLEQGGNERVARKRERIAVVLAGEQNLRGLASLDVCLIFCEETPPEARNEQNKLVEKRVEAAILYLGGEEKKESFIKIVTFQQTSPTITTTTTTTTTFKH